MSDEQAGPISAEGLEASQEHPEGITFDPGDFEDDLPLLQPLRGALEARLFRPGPPEETSYGASREEMPSPVFSAGRGHVGPIELADDALKRQAEPELINELLTDGTIAASVSAAAKVVTTHIENQTKRMEIRSQERIAGLQAGQTPTQEQTEPAGFRHQVRSLLRKGNTPAN